MQLRVLIVEDSEFDAEILVRVLRKGGYEPVSLRVDNFEAMKKALEENQWDIILADYNLPQFSALEALDLLHETGQDIPFLVISGGIGEATAVNAMKAGAHDYLMKGNLSRLVPAIEREIREAANRAAKVRTGEALRQSELRYRLLWETARDAILFLDIHGNILFANPAVKSIFGYGPEELTGRSVGELQPELLGYFDLGGDSSTRAKSKGLSPRMWQAREMVGIRKDGVKLPIEVAFSDLELDGKRLYVEFIRDISERKRIEAELRANEEQFRVAREIQQRLFPKAAPKSSGFEISGSSRPAGATGGDYFDYLSMQENCLGVVIGDVTGHGVGPALLMAETRAYLRMLCRNLKDLGQIVSQANTMLLEDVGYERFVTLLLVQLNEEKRSLRYVNAGHSPGYVISTAGEVRITMGRTGIPLGMKPKASYASSGVIGLESGETILMLTDGFEDTVGPEADASFGVERALEVVRRARERSADEIVKSLYAAVEEFSGGMPQEDDLTVIVAKVL